ncbi:MAG: ATP-binding protein [Deltaproteobacteria bacterium]|nr:ATP-binding protein [Deltaproteobacteria bacterium]
MNSVRNDSRLFRPAKFNRPFLQPLALGIVGAVFVGLILFMGIMDLRRIDRTLVGVLENRGLDIIGIIQRLAQENIHTLVQAHQQGVRSTFAPRPSANSSPQKLLVTALTELGREVDNKWKSDDLSAGYLKKFAAENSLWLVAVLNERGEAVFQNRSLKPIDDADNSSVADIGRGPFDFLTRISTQKGIPFIALRRQDGSGTIVIALDPDGSRYWATKVSIESAMSEMGGGKHLVYLVMMDEREMIFGSAGEMPPKFAKNDVQIAQVLAGTRSVVSRKIDFQGKSILDVTTSLYLNNKIVGIARVGLDRSSADKILTENRNSIFMFTFFVALTALLSVWLLYHDQNRHLAGIVEMERQLEKAERLSALGSLAAGVAHEIRNPLNAISMASQRLKREFNPVDQGKNEEFNALTGVIRDEIRRLNNIIEEFLTFSRSRKLDLRDYPLTDMLQKIVNLIREEAASQGITIQTQWGNTPYIIPMDMDKLQQALFNLIKNAMESISGEGSITLSIENSDKDRLGIKITDTGCGMSSDEIERIFSPEYTTKEKGLGLGLSLAHEIIRGHGGDIQVTSRQGSGTTFKVTLPRAKSN